MMLNFSHSRRRGVFTLSTLIIALMLSGVGTATAYGLSESEAGTPLPTAPTSVGIVNVDDDDDNVWLKTAPRNPSECGSLANLKTYRYSFRADSDSLWMSVSCNSYFKMTRAAKLYDNYAGYEFNRERLSADEDSAQLPKIDYTPVNEDEDFWNGTFVPKRPIPKQLRFIDLILVQDAGDTASGVEPSTDDQSVTATDLELKELLDTTLAACDDTDCLPASGLDEAMSDGVVSEDPGDWEQSMELTGEDDIEDEFVFKKPHTERDLMVTGCFDNLPDDFDGAWGYNAETDACITTFEDEDAALMSTGSRAATTFPAMVASLSSFITNAMKSVMQPAVGGAAGTVTLMLDEKVVQTTEVAANGSFSIALPDNGSGVHTYTMVYENQDDPEIYDYVNVTVLAAAHNDALHTVAATDAESSAAQNLSAENNNPALLITLGALFGVAVIGAILILARRRA